MSDQIFPLNVDPESPLKPKNNKKKKPTFKQWFNERKRMLGLVFGVCLVTVGAIVYPYLNLGELFKGQILGRDATEGDYIEPSGNFTYFVKDINIEPNNDLKVDDKITLNWKQTILVCIASGGYKVSSEVSPMSAVLVYNDGTKSEPFEIDRSAEGDNCGAYSDNDVFLEFNQDLVLKEEGEQYIEVGWTNSSNKFISLWDTSNSPIYVEAKLDPTSEADEVELPPPEDIVGLPEDKETALTISGSLDKTDAKPGEILQLTIQTNKAATVDVLMNEDPIKENILTKTSNPYCFQFGNCKYTATVTINTYGLGEGSHTITIKSGDIESDGISFRLTSPPTLKSTPNTDQVLTTDSVTYTLTATSPDVFKDLMCFIDYGDGESKTQFCGETKTVQFPSHKYKKPGDYISKSWDEATSTAEDNIYETTSKLTYTVSYPTTPILLIESDNLSPKIEDKDKGVTISFKLTANNLTGPYKYEIEYGDDEEDSSLPDQESNTQTFTHKYDEEGIYTVKATVTNAERTTKTATYKLEIEADYEEEVIEEEDEEEEEEDDDDDDDDDDDNDKETNCTNDKDDDRDGKKDYEDSDCKTPESQKIVISDARISRSPFNPSVNSSSILYKLNRDALVTIEIFDSSKKKVATILDGKLKPALTTTGIQANQAEYFYGKVNNDPKGQALPDGTYTYAITAANPKYATIKDTESNTVIIDSKDSFMASDWEQTGATSTSSGTTSGNTGTSGSTSAQTSSTRTALSTPTSQTSNLAALTMQNAPPGTTAGTGPEMLIYLLLPAVSAFALTRKK